MTLIDIHTRLANTVVLFVAGLAIYAIFLRVRNRPLDGSWLGAAVIGEGLILVEFALGVWLYVQFGAGSLARPWLHILYGLVAVLSLPAGYAYFSQLEDEGVKTVAMAAICIFLWGIALRASTVALSVPISPG